MKTRFVLTAVVMLVAVIFVISGCGSSNDGNDGNDFDTRQFEKGVALFGHDVGTGTHFTQHLTPKMGAELAKTAWNGHHYDSMTPLYIDGKQYVMGLSSKKDGSGYPYFIQLIFPSGDFGPTTDSGHWNNYYKTLIALTMSDGRVFLFGQKDGNSNRAFTQEVLSGGKLATDEAWHNYWSHYYDTATPLPIADDRTCFFIHNSHDNNDWYIKCLHSNGAEYVRNSGSFNHGYQVALSYREGGKSHLFGQRHHYEWTQAHTYGPWFIQNITDGSHMGSETDSGTWHNYYKTMTVFRSPEARMYYLVGHNTDKRWFIQHVSSFGHMDEEIDHGGPWAHYYEHFFPIDFDPSYLHTDNWMGRLFSEIDNFGDRKLNEVALPGSHDTGMNENDTGHCSAGGRTCNTVTQYKDIGGQLYLGARYFDIRPMIDTDESGSNDWTTGHAAKLGTDITAGCRGESKSSIVDSLNDFFADGKHAKELVILKVAHCATPPGNGYATCTDTQKSNMAHDLASRLGDHVVKGDLDLNSITLNDILDKGNIILVVQNARDRANGIFQWGYGSRGDYYIYDEYSNTEEFGVMVDGGKNNSGDNVPGQKAKLLNPDNHSGHYNGFLLSWTLTLSSYDAFKCPVGSPSNILEMAVIAQPRIYEYMYKLVDEKKITKTLFPNILYVDTFNRTTTNAAIYLNKKYDSLPD